MHRRNRFVIASTTIAGSAPLPCDKQFRRRRNLALTSNEYERLFDFNAIILASTEACH
jgi:hypothetical protein